MSTFDSSCRILILSSSKELSTDLANRIKSISGDDTLVTSNGELNDIVWSVKNKYYSASVHFRAIKLDELTESDANGSPALIYTWDSRSKESYTFNAESVATIVASIEPEVALAIGPNASDDSVNLDDYFSDLGLEYVETHAEDTTTGNVKIGSTASLGLRRAVDALSTIIWPTMVRSQSSTKSGSAASGVDETELDVLSLLASSNKSGLQREMEALEKWLEDDVDVEASSERDENDPWSFSSSSLSNAVGGAEEASSSSTVHGFDDDFSDFVSAPPPDISSQQVANDEDLDSELPSQSEVREASERIFRGAVPAELSSSPGLFSHNEDEDASESPSFDLSRVLSALQGMKEEIATIPDERERRRAAAKVALGLVYGLEGTSEELDFGV